MNGNQQEQQHAHEHKNQHADEHLHVHEHQNVEQLSPYYADMHIHIGSTSQGQAVKISGSRDLTFENIAKEARDRKGIHLAGIIDCHAPGVQYDIQSLLDCGEMTELEDGGISYQGTTLLLGSELEFREQGMGPAHVLVFFPYFSDIVAFTAWLKPLMKNVNLSSQRVHAQVLDIQKEVYSRGGMMIPAHIFTPHRSIYGTCADKMSDVLDPKLLHGVELGLSADHDMAGLISELDNYTILTNSDAHSLKKIGREYNKLLLQKPTYYEFEKALLRQEGRKVLGNYGLNPKLGKYHRTHCTQCGRNIEEIAVTGELCPFCGSKKIVTGVMDRILSIADRKTAKLPPHRPSYHYQIPLEFIPGLGPAKLRRLLETFGTEMTILHEATYEELDTIVGSELAGYICGARRGELAVSVGGGGVYGKVQRMEQAQK